MIRTEPQSDPHPSAAAVAAKGPRRCNANAGSDPRWRKIAAMILLAGLAVLMLGTFLQYGVTWDEEFQRNYGEVVLRWYTSLFRDRAALVDYSHGVGEISHYYGAAFDLVAQAAAGGCRPWVRMRPGTS